MKMKVVILNLNLNHHKILVKLIRIRRHQNLKSTEKLRKNKPKNRQCK